MIVGDFLKWAQSASAAQRTEGASALARAYLHSALDPEKRREAEIALTSLTDDRSPRVRRPSPTPWPARAKRRARSSPRLRTTSRTSPRPFYRVRRFCRRPS